MPDPTSKQIATLTPAAVSRLQELKEGRNVYALRIGLEKGGCAGMEYTMDYADQAAPGDALVEQDGVRVLIAPTAVMFMLGTEIDYETGLLESGFRFKNPNVVDACGCGESIKFDLQLS